MARPKKSFYRTCSYCEWFATGTNSSQGRTCKKNFITDVKTDARECEHFSLGELFVCLHRMVLIDLKVCLSRQDSRSIYCPSKCLQGNITRDLYSEKFYDGGDIPKKKCKNLVCNNEVPDYREYCSLACWANPTKKPSGSVSYLFKLPEEQKQSKLRRVQSDEAETEEPKISKLRRISYV